MRSYLICLSSYNRNTDAHTFIPILENMILDGEFTDEINDFSMKIYASWKIF